MSLDPLSLSRPTSPCLSQLGISRESLSVRSTLPTPLGSVLDTASVHGCVRQKTIYNRSLQGVGSVVYCHGTGSNSAPAPSTPLSRWHYTGTCQAATVAGLSDGWPEGAQGTRCGCGIALPCSTKMPGGAQDTLRYAGVVIQNQQCGVKARKTHASRGLR